MSDATHGGPSGPGTDLTTDERPDDGSGTVGQPQSGHQPRPLFQTPRLPGVHLFRQATPAPNGGVPSPSLTSGAAARNLDDLYTAADAIAQAQVDQAHLLAAIYTAAQSALDLLVKAHRPGVGISINLSASRAYTLDTQDYAHSYLLLTAPQAVTFDVPGAGAFTRSLAADYNRLDYPSGTRLTLASEPASPINGLLRLQDQQIDV